MTPELTALIEKARHYKMSPREKFEQRVSFVYGQQDYGAKVQRTKDEVREHLAEIYGVDLSEH